MSRIFLRSSRRGIGFCSKFYSVNGNVCRTNHTAENTLRQIGRFFREKSRTQTEITSHGRMAPLRQITLMIQNCRRHWRGRGKICAKDRHNKILLYALSCVTKKQLWNELFLSRFFLFYVIYSLYCLRLNLIRNCRIFSEWKSSILCYLSVKPPFLLTMNKLLLILLILSPLSCLTYCCILPVLLILFDKCLFGLLFEKIVRFLKPRIQNTMNVWIPSRFHGQVSPWSVQQAADEARQIFRPYKILRSLFKENL